VLAYFELRTVWTLARLVHTQLTVLAATDHVAFSHIDLTDVPVYWSEWHCCTHNSQFLTASSSDKTAISTVRSCRLPLHCLLLLLVAKWFYYPEFILVTSYCNSFSFICASLIQALNSNISLRHLKLFFRTHLIATETYCFIHLCYLVAPLQLNTTPTLRQLHCFFLLQCDMQIIHAHNWLTVIYFATDLVSFLTTQPNIITLVNSLSCILLQTSKRFVHNYLGW